MRNPIRTLARPMLASMFVVGGLDALRHPGPRVGAARDVTDPLTDAAAQKLPADKARLLDDLDPEDLVRANGAAQLLGGLALATGRAPRLAAALLAGSLVPTTLAGHRFWEEDDAEVRGAQRTHFLKNVSLLGGLLLATFDREGKPSATWRAGHAVEHVALQGRHAKREARLAARAAKAEAGVKAAQARTAAKMAGAGAGLAAAATSATAKRAGADARRKGALAKQRAALELAHQRDTAGTRAELVKKKLTPDVTDAKRLVDAIRS